MEVVETEVPPLSKEDVKTINVDTSLKSKARQHRPSQENRLQVKLVVNYEYCEEATHVIDKIVSMEDVESTEFTLSSKDNTPSVEDIIKWSPDQVITFLKSKSDELYLREKDINIIEKDWVSGRAFLLLEFKELRNELDLDVGPANSIANLIETLKDKRGK